MLVLLNIKSRRMFRHLVKVSYNLKGKVSSSAIVLFLSPCTKNCAHLEYDCQAGMVHSSKFGHQSFFYCNFFKSDGLLAKSNYWKCLLNNFKRILPNAVRKAGEKSRYNTNQGNCSDGVIMRTEVPKNKIMSCLVAVLPERRIDRLITDAEIGFLFVFPSLLSVYVCRLQVAVSQNVYP